MISYILTDPLTVVLLVSLALTLVVIKDTINEEAEKSIRNQAGFKPLPLKSTTASVVKVNFKRSKSLVGNDRLKTASNF